ncbi:hypothetical protein AB3N60_04930 [Leptospira sp. WS39.C2]
MRKFPKTYEVTISLEHLPILETKLQEMGLEWEETGDSFFQPFQIKEWKTRREALGHSGISVTFYSVLPMTDSILYFLFPNRYEKKKKIHLTNALLEKIPNTIKPIPAPNLKEVLNKWWNEPTRLVFGNLSEIHASLGMEGLTNPIQGRHLQIHSGESKLIFRIGFLKTIQYRFHSRRFKPPYPKLAECYIQTRDTNTDKSFGKVYYSFIGYLLKEQNDEYLLPFYHLKPLVPKEIRKLIPIEIWNQLVEEPNSDWLETNLNADELEFRPVYQVSTSLPHHPK